MKILSFNTKKDKYFFNNKYIISLCSRMYLSFKTFLMKFCKKNIIIIIPDFIYILIFIKIKIFKLIQLRENFCVGLYFYAREIFRRLKIKIKIIFFLFLLDSRRHKTKFKVLKFLYERNYYDPLISRVDYVQKSFLRKSCKKFEAGSHDHDRII